MERGRTNSYTNMDTSHTKRVNHTLRVQVIPTKVFVRFGFATFNYCPLYKRRRGCMRPKIQIGNNVLGEDGNDLFIFCIVVVASHSFFSVKLFSSCSTCTCRIFFFFLKIQILSFFCFPVVYCHFPWYSYTR